MEKPRYTSPSALRSEIDDIAASGTFSPTEDSISLHDVQNFQNILQESHLEDDQATESELEDGLEPELREQDLQYTSGGQVLSFDFWSILGRGAINLILPFINGIALGFGEILAHEVGFRYGLLGARVYPPTRLERRKKPESKYI